MSKILSTESNNKIPTGGMPTVMSIVDKTIVPAPGTAGVPMDAKSEVIMITSIASGLNSIEKSCAKKNTAITWYNAVPSMFTVVPNGITNFETYGFIFRLSSAVFNVTGIVAIELAVEKDTVCGLRNFENVEDIGLFAMNFKIKT